MGNSGVAFGIWQGIPIALVSAFWVGLFVYALKMRELWGRIGVILMLIGGGMNIFERLRYGYVMDNWKLGELIYNNLADYLIVAGLVVYGYSYFVRRRRSGRD